VKRLGYLPYVSVTWEAAEVQLHAERCARSSALSRCSCGSDEASIVVPACEELEIER
jgi:hypothetical protein